MSDEHPRRILLAAPLPPPNGGAATWTGHVIRPTLGDPRIEVRHFELASWSKRRGLKQNVFAFPRRIFGLLRELQRMRRALRSFRPHLVHLTSFAGAGSFRDIAVVRLARAAGCACLLDFHTSRLGVAEPFRLVRALTARAVRSASGIRALEPGCEAWLRTVATGPVRRIPNMIDLAEIAAGSPPDAPQPPISLVFVGRVVPAKGVVELTAACSRVEGVELELVGPVEPRLERRLRALASRREDGRWFRAVGEIDPARIGERIRAADVVALTSHAEAFPYAILEGMARSRPALVTPVGALPEMVASSSQAPCGVVTRDLSAPAIEDGIRRLAADAETLSEMGRRARDRVALHYSTQRVLPALRSFWLELAGGSAR